MGAREHLCAIIVIERSRVVPQQVKCGADCAYPEEVIDFTFRKSLFLATLLASSISILLYLAQPREKQVTTISSDELVGYEAPWIHPRDLMRRQAQLSNSLD